MRFFAFASLLALASALPAALSPVSEHATDLATRGSEAVAPAVIVDRQAGGNPFDQTYSWPSDSVYGGGISVQFEATNLGGGKYRFDFWNTGPLNGGDWNFRVSNAGNTLGEKVVAPRGTASIEVQQTGENFNIYISHV
ncbi:hypothetical protein CPLU01_01811 [Colletotrichum plurivorum]|uniref:Uncharacterized protein n=1 Tax=Colletotrichum plurivorum TaxID=2175906 RepID=A0A8H6KY44_9PEZI|nr:hypothetical protein CPLU01_01811 [Colletotrichum plurivorum]